ncbi:MAG TPA: hydroxysqualene dehydroxylase HpnE [Variovorax sp.]|nr:hydroxysqualene dehydroxylase HpnE [Variovorax sp.]
MRIAVIGAGWAGLACAVEATRAGHHVTLFEAARTAGGRARRIEGAAAGASSDPPLDNGQHILVGAYRETLALMRTVGIDPQDVLLRLPLSLRRPDGSGLAVPAGWPAPLDLLAGIVTARGWTWRDKASLLRSAWAWRRAGFRCADDATVGDLCRDLTPRAMDELIDPLCVSALNTPSARASGQVFLTVLRDALFGEPGGADLLLPRVDLGALLPDAALAWLADRGATVRLGTRVDVVERGGAGDSHWRIEGVAIDHVVLACASWDAVRLLHGSAIDAPAWSGAAEALRFEAIATVYLEGASPLSTPMLALRSSPDEPAQFAFDRTPLGGPAGRLALVVSAADAPRDVLERQVRAQARAVLGQPSLQVLRTIVEKRATFACTPGLRRPGRDIAEAISACGDHVEGPYPATLEGAVRSGLDAARCLPAAGQAPATR